MNAVKMPTLIVIDILNDFLQSWPPAARGRIIESTNALVTMMRRRERPVIWVR